eukprot:GEMP01025486.1.p1 GENE.GEMP01025486.1~~GEMP01025486.1.p1  ORF type:complete len:206 (+),score=48.97 GEMP01025486.1:150-767(+)
MDDIKDDRHRSSSTRVYVADLRPDTTASHIFTIFRRFGECDVEMISNPNDYAATVEFQDDKAARDAVKFVHHASIRGRTARVIPYDALDTITKTKQNRVIVMNLDRAVEPTGIADVFDLFGVVLDCKIEEDMDEHASRGRAFAHYRTAEEAQGAFDNLNNMKVGDNQLILQLYKDVDDFDSLFSGVSYATQTNYSGTGIILDQLQ